jgi:hypothetical protein
MAKNKQAKKRNGLPKAVKSLANKPAAIKPESNLKQPSKLEEQDLQKSIEQALPPTPATPPNNELMEQAPPAGTIKVEILAGEPAQDEGIELGPQPSEKDLEQLEKIECDADLKEFFERSIKMNLDAQKEVYDEFLNGKMIIYGNLPWDMFNPATAASCSIDVDFHQYLKQNLTALNLETRKLVTTELAIKDPGKPAMVPASFYIQDCENLIVNDPKFRRTVAMFIVQSLYAPPVPIQPRQY